MIKIDKRTYINRFSYFKLQLNSIVTPQGDTVDLNTVNLIFDFRDKLNNSYKAIYSPKASECENVVYDSESNKLTILFQDYKLAQGQLSCQIGTMTADDDFEDKEWQFFGDREQINIILK